MTLDRFPFQRSCVERVTGKVLNVGCKEDPSHLKEYGRTTNMDLRPYDQGIYFNSGTIVPIPVDVLHDATVTPWPFEDDEFDLVVLGDILEDLPDNECQLVVLKEAARVSTHLCVTTPEDTPARDWHHFTTITEKRLKDWLDQAGWTIDSFDTVDYGFDGIHGFFVFATRKMVQ